MTREILIRIVLVVGSIAAWFFLKDRFPILAHGIGYWSDRTSPSVVKGVGMAGATLLGLTLIGLIRERLGRLVHTHSYDAHLGRWLSNLLIGLILIAGAALALGALLRSRLTILSIGSFTILLALWLLVGLIVESLKSRRKKRAMRPPPT